MVLKSFSKGSVGNRLRQARDARGVDLDRASQDTGIDRHVLQALEEDARPGQVAPMWARIYLREYSRYLGLDSRRLVGAYRSAHPEPDRPLLGGPLPVERGPRGWRVPTLTVVSVLALMLVTLLNARPSPQQIPDRIMGPEPASPAATTPPPLPSPPATAEELRLRITIGDLPSWVRMARGESVLMEGTLEPGTVRVFRARHRLDFVLGNAGAVRLTANGQPLVLGPEDDGVYIGTVVLTDGTVRLMPLV